MTKLLGHLDGTYRLRDDGASPDDLDTKAVKYDSSKLRMELFSPIAFMGISQVLQYGADEKYSDHNWRKGFRWTRNLSAMLRHLFAWWMGQDKDPTTGFSHLWHAGFNLMVLIEFEALKQGIDDRYKFAVSDDKLNALLDSLLTYIPVGETEADDANGS